jgi:predicted aspartyl protease
MSVKRGILKFIRPPGIFLSLLLVRSPVAADPFQPELPPEMAINKEAVRAGIFSVTLRLESGEELPFDVDTGTSVTILDSSLETRLGKKLGRWTFETLHGKEKLNVYAAPKLYLRSVSLMTGKNVATCHFGRPSGILGMDCLCHYCIQLDFETGKMRFLDPSLVDTAKSGKAFPITFRGVCPFIHHGSLTGNGSNAYSRIDTGFNIDGRVRVGKDVIREPNSGEVYLPKCVWDGNTYTNLLVVAGGEDANLIGLRFLARHLVTLDFPERTLYLKQTSVGPLQ